MSNEIKSRKETVKEDEVRASAETDEARQTRMSSARTDEVARGSKEGFKRMLDDFRYQPLPDPPKIPGYHLIWLSETHGQQSVNQYLRLGYQLVRVEEVSGQGFDSPQTGEYAGFVKVNEMLLAKIPEEHYLAAMEHYHHDEPLADEETIREQAEAQADSARSAGGRVDLEEGMRSLGRSGFNRPTFDS